MKQITEEDTLNIGDYVLIESKPENIERVYKIKDILFDFEERLSYIRENIYSKDGSFGPRERQHLSMVFDNCFLLDEKELNHYLKLAIFSS